MYRTYLSTSSHKRQRKKMNITMVEPFAVPLAAWLLRLGQNPRRTSDRLLEGAVEGFFLTMDIGGVKK
jgi:hypothetical protein